MRVLVVLLLLSFSMSSPLFAVTLFVQCDTFIIPDKDVVNIGSDPTLAHLDAMLFELFGRALLEYAKQFNNTPFDLSKDTGYTYFDMTRTNSKNHTDKFLNFGSMHASAVAVLFLTDQVAGGQFFFPIQQVTVEPECGKFLFFPNSYAFPYQIRKIRLGALKFVVTGFGAY
jgi:hypothetical protein